MPAGINKAELEIMKQEVIEAYLIANPGADRDCIEAEFMGPCIGKRPDKPPDVQFKDGGAVWEIEE